MSRRRRSASRGRGDKALGVALAFVGVILICALAGGAWWLRKTKVPLDADNCPLTGPRAIHVIMIDRSDPISGQQAQRIRQYMQNLKNRASSGTRFDVYTFEGDIKNEMHPTAQICSPGRPEDANELYENPNLIRKRYEERFSSVLDRTIDDLLQVSTLPNSPIIESIRAAAITSFGPVASAAVPLHMTLVSDMIQNTSLASQFRANSSFAELSKNPSWSRLRPNLKGADVDILYLARPEAKRAGVPIQNRGHQLFWEQLISASGGRLDRVEPL